MAAPRKPAAKTPAPPAATAAPKPKATRVSLQGRAGSVSQWNTEAYSVAVEFDDEPNVLANIRVDQLQVL